MDNPFTEGRDAFVFETLRRECPYPESSDEREDWEEGWDDAKADRKLTDIDQRKEDE